MPVATDVDGTIASYQMVSTVSEGSLTFNPDGTYSFDPGSDFDDLAAGATRTVTFTYTATDNNGAVSEPSTITITVTGTDDAPVASDDATQNTGENAVLSSSVPVATDVDGTIASYQMVTTVSEGSLTFNPDGTYSFDPGSDFDDLAAGATRTVTFTYTATDINGSVSEASTVTITVTGTNDAPVVENDTAAISDGVATITIDALANDTDLDGGSLTLLNATVPQEEGVVEIVDNKINFTPADGFVGTSTVIYTTSDGTSTSIASIQILVSFSQQEIATQIDTGESLLTSSASPSSTAGVIQLSDIELLPLDYEPVLLDVLDGISDLLGQANLSTAQPNLNLISEFNVIEDLIQSEANRIDTQDFAQSESLVDEEFLLLDEPDTENSTTLNQENLDEDLIASLQTSERFSSQLSKILDSNQAELEVFKKMLS